MNIKERKAPFQFLKKKNFIIKLLRIQKASCDLGVMMVKSNKGYENGGRDLMHSKGRLKDCFQKYKHAWVFLYGFIYMPWFRWLENRAVRHYYIIHSPLDNYIPFVEYFIIPYYLWFPFMIGGVLYFFFTDKKGFYRLVAFLITGMTAFLVISTVFPNGLDLRPAAVLGDNIFVDMVKFLYKVDTPTNVLPSIHVFNSIGIAIAVCQSEELKKHRNIQWMCTALAGLIILSTMFLKQHSVTDVAAAFALACAIYPAVYSSTAEEREACPVKHAT